MLGSISILKTSIGDGGIGFWELCGYLWGETGQHMGLGLEMYLRAKETISQLIFTDWKRGQYSVTFTTSDLQDCQASLSIKDPLATLPTATQ